MCVLPNSVLNKLHVEHNRSICAEGGVALIEVIEHPLDRRELGIIFTLSTPSAENFSINHYFTFILNPVTTGGTDYPAEWFARKVFFRDGDTYILNSKKFMFLHNLVGMELLFIFIRYLWVIFFLKIVGILPLL